MKKQTGKLVLGKSVIANLSSSTANSVLGGSGTCTGTCVSHTCTAALGQLAGAATTAVVPYEPSKV